MRHNFTQATPPFVEQEQATETTQEVISVEYETYIKRLKQTWKIPEAPPCVSWVAKAVEPIQQPEIAVEFDWAGETAKQVGIVVHQMLQQIGRQGLETWEVSRIRKLRGSFSSALTRLGVPQDELSEASQRVCNALEQTLLDEKGQWILGRHQEARCEYPLTFFI